MRQIAALLVLLGSVDVLTQPALKIVVLEGEGAVNIIQQKTAVRALVEVRDQNNLPVPGAAVTFAVTGKGGATVAGAQTVTVSTNAAGQAALGGMTPASSGGMQIAVNASYNGLSATTTITQTVVATAAAAAGIAAGAATGAAAGGGGLSTGAIVGIVGGAVAVGGGVAVAGGGGDESSGTNTDGGSGGTGGGQGATPLPACVFAVSPTVLTVPFEGGTFTVTVAMTPSACANPDWPVTNIPSFVTATPTSGRGNGTVTIVVAPFTPTMTFPARSDAIGIASTVVHIHQPRAVTAAAAGLILGGAPVRDSTRP